MNYGYIYKTTNLVNGKIYIGQHKSNKFDPKYKGSGVHFKNAIKKYGETNFITEMLDSSANNAAELNELEIYYIDKYNARDPDYGYNIHCGGNVQSGENNPMYGKRFKHTQEAINKIKQSHTGKSLTYEIRKKISDARKAKFASEGLTTWNKGISTGSRSQESISKISKTLKDRWEDDEFRAKMNRIYQSRIGRDRGESFREKQRENAKGNTNVRGYKWYTNGICDIRCTEGSQPAGYSHGRRSKSKTKINQ